MWISFGLFSAILLGFYDIAKKHALKENSTMHVLLMTTFMSGVLMSFFPVISYLNPHWALSKSVYIGSLSYYQHGLLFLKAFIVGVSWVFSYMALKSLPISMVAPIRASGPVWTLLGAYFLFLEKPSLLQIIAILLILISFYAFSVIGKKEGIVFLKNKFIAYIFLATWVGTLSTLFDKYLLHVIKLDPLTILTWYSIYMALIQAIFFVGLKSYKKNNSFKFRVSILLIGLFLLVADWFYFIALEQEDALVTILSALRRSNVIISFGIGGILFKDQFKRQKAIPLLGVLVGVVLLTLYS